MINSLYVRRISGLKTMFLKHLSLLQKYAATYQMKFLLELFAELADEETLIPLPEDCTILFICWPLN